MSKDMKTIAKKTMKYAGAFAVGTSVFALSAVVASGAALGAVAEGFKAAGNVTKKILNESKFTDEEVMACEEVEEVCEEVELKEVASDVSKKVVTEENVIA